MKTSLEESLESLNFKSLNALESLENGQILLCFPHSEGSLESLQSLKSLEPLEKDFFKSHVSKDPFVKDPEKCFAHPLKFL